MSLTLQELCNRKFKTTKDFAIAANIGMYSATKLLQGRKKDSQHYEEKRHIANVLGVSLEEYEKATSESFDELVRPYRECEKELRRTVEDEWDRKFKRWKEQASQSEMHGICTICEYPYYSYTRFDEGKEGGYKSVGVCCHGWEYLILFDPDLPDAKDD